MLIETIQEAMSERSQYNSHTSNQIQFDELLVYSSLDVVRGLTKASKWNEPSCCTLYLLATKIVGFSEEIRAMSIVNTNW